ncbi:MAG: hypothetical protein LKE48_04940 [Solobacterium sp.]|nr:hypothetical protein [Solobacterium sp.]
MTRYKYYEMKNGTLDLGRLMSAEQSSQYNSILGWCPKSVDSLADRLQFNGFKDDNFDIGEIFEMNNPDVFFDSAILSALVSSCCFIYISADET